MCVRLCVCVCVCLCVCLVVRDVQKSSTGVAMVRCVCIV